MPSAQVVPVVTRRMRALCVQPYPLHPKGCPKYGKCDSCPPKIRFLEDYFDMSQPLWAIWNVYPIGEHVQKMRATHPDWSERQLSCVLYWQPTARKQLEAEIASFKRAHPELAVTRCPEAMGLNVTETLASVGIVLEWP